MNENSNYNECFVAFIDILGFKNFVESSTGSFDKIEKALLYLSNIIGSGHNYTVEDKKISIQTQIRVFSDNIAIFRPVESSSFGFFLSQINDINIQLYILGLPVRGAITKGKMHWNPQWFIKKDYSVKEQLLNKYREGSGNMQNIIFGEGLNSAYALESTVAIYPRIILSNALFNYLKENKDNPKITDSFCLTNANKGMNVLDFIKEDFDGLLFFDFLNKDIKYKIAEDQNIGEGYIETNIKELGYDNFLEKVLNLGKEGFKSAKDEKIKQKYGWLNSYVKSKCIPNPD